jgi:transcriptional regulator with PAS, ATPase and Fis domain
MHAIRSLLWIGPAPGLAESGLLDCPTLDISWVADVAGALALPPSSFDAEILDAQGLGALSDAHGLAAMIRRLRRSPRRSPLLIRVESQGASARAALIAAGATELLVVKPGSSPEEARGELVSLVDRLSENQAWSGRTPAVGSEGAAELRDAPGRFLPGVIGRSRAIESVLALVERARSSTATVLLSGETGTGKEVVARGLHASGPRAGKPFVAVNCGAFPDSLLESELFGHVRGAFTGADRNKPGLFFEADGGTLFLDEIGETSPSLQVSLLRVLQEREVRPVGSSRSRPVDVRVIAATNRSLRDEAARGFFREDLYYRLAVFPITVPPLRERREDILPLADHFLALHGKREGKRGCRLSRPAAHLLLAYDWPGNVRELENEMHRALALAEPGDLIQPSLLSDWVIDIVEPIEQSVRAGEPLRENMNRIEAWLIRRTLEQLGGRRAATARKLGITREGLYKNMKRLGVE